MLHHESVLQLKISAGHNSMFRLTGLTPQVLAVLSE